MAKNKAPSIDLGPQGPHLELSEFERLTTRFFATQITADQLPEVREGKLRLNLDDESIRFWADCMSDDFDRLTMRA
jgi:hypothetical protein